MKKVLSLILAAVLLAAVLSGCAATERRGTEVAVKYMGNNIRVASTSVATAEILDALGYNNVVGVPKVVTSPLPERYRNVTNLGSPMIPNSEVLVSVKPDLVLSPISLHEQLQKQYDSLHLPCYFLDLESPDGMYRSIEDLGTILGREKQAEKLCSGYQNWKDSLQSRHKKGRAPRVLILMGLPGDYMACTDHSYVGSLVKLLGGKNLYTSSKSDFVQVNPEDMLKKNPDIILRTSHAMPEQTRQMFDKEFRENAIWKHFDAVKAGRVYDLPNDLFGMSAKLNYREAVRYLEPLLYPGN